MLWRWLLATLLIAHGLVHLAVWPISGKDEKGVDITDSWILGSHRWLVIGLAVGATALFCFVGLALLLRLKMWRAITIAAAAASLALVALFPGPVLSPWLMAPVAIDVGLIVSIAWLSWPSREALGA